MPDVSRVGASAPASMIRWPTGAKLFVILSIALLPLAVIAVFATLRITQIADMEARAALRVAAAESSRALAIELVGDMTALRAAVDSLETDPQDAPSCARVQGVFARQIANGTRFAVFNARGRLLCGSQFQGGRRIAGMARDEAVSARIVANEGLLLGVVGRSRDVTAAAFFPADFLAELSRPSGFTPAYSATLEREGETLPLETLPRESAFERREASISDLGVGELKLAMEVRTAPITSPLVIALLLPLVMWAAAASISWFVVDRLLIRPLRQLRAHVASFTPGQETDASIVRSLPAQELRELGDTFRALTRTVAIHEAGLAEGLVRQTKLTREVHHRVKNNLQVISSLINFHARGAKTPEASEAYSSIQRRVDALAVVHRNHYAEMEENRGLSLRPALGELASNIRATAGSGAQLGIQLDIDPYLVTQDVAVAVAFLITELIELASTCDPAAQVRVSLKDGGTPERATLRVSSRGLIESVELREGLATRFGRVTEGLSRQLRAPLHHDPLAGAYEISIAVLGRD